MRSSFFSHNERRRPDDRLPGRRAGRGNSLLEVQVAFILLGIGLAGLCQLVTIQLRQVRILEKRLQGQVVETNAGTGTSTTMLTANTYYLVPWQNPWTRKLSGAAQISGSPTISCDPGPRPKHTSMTPSPVTVVELDVPLTSQEVMVFKTGQPPTATKSSSQSITAYVDVSGS